MKGANMVALNNGSSLNMPSSVELAILFLEVQDTIPMILGGRKGNKPQEIIIQTKTGQIVATVGETESIIYIQLSPESKPIGFVKAHMLQIYRQLQSD